MTVTEVAGRYRLERRLGRGGITHLHLARDTVLDRPVLVKLLAVEHDDADVRAGFRLDGRVAAALSHPNIVRVYDTGEAGDQAYIVMEYVEGDSLATHLRRRGRLPAPEVAALGVQACAALAHAHEAGIVHRDIRPQNLFLREDGVLKVSDFGLAPRPAATAHLAPELARGERATAAADLYSLGAVLYELLTGQPPREGGGTPTPVRELAPDTPSALARAVTRCLAPEPHRRPAAASELALELEAETTRVHAAPARRRRRSSGRLWPLLAGAAGVAVAAATLWLALGGRGEDAPPPVARVPVGATPAEDARHLAAWLRANAER